MNGVENLKINRRTALKVALGALIASGSLWGVIEAFLRNEFISGEFKLKSHLDIGLKPEWVKLLIKSIENHNPNWDPDQIHSTLLEKLEITSSPPTGDAFLKAHACIVEDFKQNKTQEINGWLLSETEIQICWIFYQSELNA